MFFRLRAGGAAPVVGVGGPVLAFDSTLFLPQTCDAVQGMIRVVLCIFDAAKVRNI